MRSRGLCNGNRRAILVVAAVAALAIVPVGAYANGAPSSVRAAARAAVAKIGRQSHATGTRLLGCRRSTLTRYFCQAQNSFRTGAGRCVADVKVTLGRPGGRPRATITSYACY
jgi:hypothetical protein